MDFLNDPDFTNIDVFPSRIWLSSPTMHGDEQRWVDEAIRTNWVSTVGANIDAIEKRISEMIGCGYAVGLSSGTAALHLATRLAGEKLYGQPKANRGSLFGQRVFCADMTFAASINPVAYEGGEAVFIDTERDTWNMDPEALKRAFQLHPEVKLVILAHLYGTPGKMAEIRAICEAHGALIVEDAAESFGAKYRLNGTWVETGTLGRYNCISFNGNKVITGSSGGMFLTDRKEDADLVRKWSTQSRELAPWYQHQEIGFNYRMSNLIAGIIRGQLPYLEEHIAQKRAVYERYEKGLSDLPVRMNPWDRENSVPNFWLSCCLIDEDAMAPMKRDELRFTFEHVKGKSSPQEILGALAAFNAEGRPIWKPMHLQPIYREHEFVTAREGSEDVGADIFRRGVCLPSDNKMTAEQQERVIEIIHRCFR